MSITAFLLIVTSAFFHATWNIIAKKNKMTWLFYTLLASTCWLVWFHVLIWTPVPYSQLSWKFWCWILGSTTVAELFYCGGVCYCYRRLEMSVAYPMMRALPVLSVALITTLLGFGAPLSLTVGLGMTVVFIGCLMMPLKKFSDFSIRKYLNSGMLAIIIAALGTTGYTICDSQAQKAMAECIAASGLDISKTVMSLSYYIIRLTILCTFFWSWQLIIPSTRRIMKESIPKMLPHALPAGVFASGCYILALISMQYVTNVSYVQVFRQMGLVLGMLGSVIFLKEKLTVTKVAGVILIVGGLVMTVIEKLL